MYCIDLEIFLFTVICKWEISIRLCCLLLAQLLSHILIAIYTVKHFDSAASKIYLRTRDTFVHKTTANVTFMPFSCFSLISCLGIKLQLWKSTNISFSVILQAKVSCVLNLAHLCTCMLCSFASLCSTSYIHIIHISESTADLAFESALLSAL